jgi:hypothetical protein
VSYDRGHPYRGEEGEEEPASERKHEREDAIQGKILECSTKAKNDPQAEVQFPRDATKITPMAGVTKSSGRSLYFTCNTLEQGK